MKFFRYSVLAIALAAGFASCSDDDDPVLGPQSPGVYFPTDDALEVTLDRKANTFEVTVSRLGETPEVTYNLVGEADSEVFTLPTSVKFAEGETTTKVSIAYDQDAMKLDKAYDVFLGFAEGTVISDYGYSSLEMAVTLPAPWKTIGTGTYHDCWLLAMTKLSEDPEFKPEWECELQQNEVTPTRYRWVHPYGENFAKFCAANGVGTLEDSEYDSKGQYYVEFVCDPKYGKAVIPLQSLGFQFFSDGVMNILNDAYYIMASENKTYAQVATEDPESCAQVTYGKVKEENENGEEVEVETILSIFSNDKTCLAGFEGSSSLYYAGSGYNWVREGVEIKDYDINIAYEGVLTLPNETERVFATIKLGADVKTAKTGLVKTDDPEAAISAVEKDEVATQTLEKQDNAVRFAFDGSGDYTLAVIAYNDKDEAVASNTLKFFVADNSKPKDWVAAGTGTYYDRFCLPMYGMGDTNAWSVAIEQNNEDPNLYRWVHPYGTEFFNYMANELKKQLAPTQYDSNNELYVQFRVVDGLVAILPSDSGVMFNEGDGYMTIMNAAGYNLDGGISWDIILANKPEFFGNAAMDGNKIAEISSNADGSLVSFEFDEGPYNWRDDNGGLNWVSGASKAPAKLPSLKEARNLTKAQKIKSNAILEMDPRTFCGRESNLTLIR